MEKQCNGLQCTVGLKNRKVSLKVNTSRTPALQTFFRQSCYNQSLVIKTKFVFSFDSVPVRSNVNEHITTQPFICSVHVHPFDWPMQRVARRHRARANANINMFFFLQCSCQDLLGLKVTKRCIKSYRCGVRAERAAGTAWAMASQHRGSSCYCCDS